jgi:hypothetical protein
MRQRLHWLDYDPVAFAVLVTGMGMIARAWVGNAASPRPTNRLPPRNRHRHPTNCVGPRMYPSFIVLCGAGSILLRGAGSWFGSSCPGANVEKSDCGTVSGREISVTSEIGGGDEALLSPWRGTCHPSGFRCPSNRRCALEIQALDGFAVDCVVSQSIRPVPILTALAQHILLSSNLSSD